MNDDALVRSACDDLLERDGQALVLTGSEVTLLSPLATAAVLHCADGSTVAALAARLEGLFGAPAGGDIGEAVRALVLELEERGILVIEAPASGAAP